MEIKELKETNKALAAEQNKGIQILLITSYSENQIVTEDGERYFFENAKATIENVKEENKVSKAVIVNGKCTSILTDLTN